MVLQPHLIHAILNEPWAISAESLEAFAPLIHNVLNSNIAFERAEPLLPETVSFLATVEAGTNAASGSQTAQKQIRVITIRGALTKYSQSCGPTGMLEMGKWIQEADADPRIDAIVLRIDSPGGMVAGTETLADIIGKTSKPVVAFVDDMAASAAYWIASEADEIIANNTTAQIGSIGVLLSMMDLQPALEKMGVKFHTILAPQSTNKTRLFEKIRSGDYAEYKEQVLKPLANKFIDTVKSNRPGATDEHFKGDVFFANELIGTLIDSIGGFETALERAAVLADKQVSPTSQNNMKKTELNRLAKAAGVLQLESADGTINLTAEMAQAVEKALEAFETEQANLRTQIKDHTDQQSRVTELEGQLQTATDRIAELENGAGADSATVHKDTDTQAEAVADDFWGRFNKLSNSPKSNSNGN